MLNLIKNFRDNFRADEDGAITVDWVVLTALVVGLGIAVLTTIGNGTTVLSERISAQLEAQTIGPNP